MKQESKIKVLNTIRQFKLPKYEEIPDVGLYLEQTSIYMNQFFKVLPDMEITTSMISNYIKKGLVARSVKKKYYRDQIASLFFIAISKNVLSIDRINQLFELQLKTYDTHIAYEYMRLELENIIAYVFSMKDQLDDIGVTSSDEKEMLRNTLLTFSHKIYLDLCLEAVSQAEK